MIVYLSCMADSYPMSVMIPVIIIFTHTFLHIFGKETYNEYFE